MPVISDATVSAAASKLSNKPFIAFLVVSALATMIYYWRPSRLIAILLAAMTETRKIYREAREMGLPVQAEITMDTLRQKVSAMVEETQHNSESWSAAFCDFLRGRTFILLRCIDEVQSFGKHIKMLKDMAQLRTESNLSPWPTFSQPRGRSLWDYFDSWVFWISACSCRLRRSLSGCLNHLSRMCEQLRGTLRRSLAGWFPLRWPRLPIAFRPNSRTATRL
ncbi:hypothetical protein C8R45DRAFT_1003020, partial [Mycena sanguinolenta]